MKITREKLKQIIKEELEEMMIGEQGGYKFSYIDSVLWSDLVEAMKAKNPAAKVLDGWAGSAEKIHITYLDPSQSQSLGIDKKYFCFWKTDPFLLIQRSKTEEELKQLFLQNGRQIGSTTGDDLVNLLNNPEDKKILKTQLQYARNNMDFLFALQDKIKQFRETQQYQKSKSPVTPPVQERKKR